jgi:hypothetical protein
MMGGEYICDGCGKRAPAEHNNRDYFKPSAWFQRVDEDGIQDACCRECIQKIAKKSGKTSIILPGF